MLFRSLANMALAAGDARRAIELLTPLDQPKTLTSEIAFLLQRSYTRLKDDSAARLWQAKAETLRKEESIKDAADQILRDTPGSDWAAVIRAYKYADQGNWGEAESIMKSLGQTSHSQPFIRDLSEAVKTRGKLPSLLDLPVRDH